MAPAALTVGYCEEGPAGPATYQQEDPGPGQTKGLKIVSWSSGKAILPTPRGELKQSLLDVTSFYLGDGTGHPL